MIYSLKGTLVHTEQNLAVVECGGVGYGCRTTLNTLKDLKLNTEVKLYTYMSVREDAVELFGFSTVSELNTYKLLINVNGVGPKAGISILSILSPEQVAVAVSSGGIFVVKVNSILLMCSASPPFTASWAFPIVFL